MEKSERFQSESNRHRLIAERESEKWSPKTYRPATRCWRAIRMTRIFLNFHRVTIKGVVWNCNSLLQGGTGFRLSPTRPALNVVFIFSWQLSPGENRKQTNSSIHKSVRTGHFSSAVGHQIICRSYLVVMGRKSNGESNLNRKGLTRVKREELKKLVEELLQSETFSTRLTLLSRLMYIYFTHRMLIFGIFYGFKRLGDLQRVVEPFGENLWDWEKRREISNWQERGLAFFPGMDD